MSDEKRQEYNELNRKKDGALGPYAPPRVPTAEPASPVAPAPDAISEAICEMKPARRSLAEKAQEPMSDFERDYPWGGPVAPAPVATAETAQTRIKLHDFFVHCWGSEAKWPMSATDAWELIEALTPPPQPAGTPQRAKPQWGAEIAARAEFGELEDDAPPTGTPEPLREALRNLLDACLKADAHDELSEVVDGSLLDAARAALAAAPPASQPPYARFAALAERIHKEAAIRKQSPPIESGGTSALEFWADELDALIAELRGGKILRCQERHAEGGQCELRLGHENHHLSGTIWWARPAAPPQEREAGK